MGKSELVEFIASKAGMTKADAAKALEYTIEGITAGLKKEGKVALLLKKELLEKVLIL